MTNIYYRRVTTFCKYPNQDKIDKDMIHYSTNKKGFYGYTFFQTDISLNMLERKNAVAQFLKIKPKNIALIKA